MLRRILRIAAVIIVGALVLGPGRFLYGVWAPAENILPLPKPLVALASPEGQTFLATSTASVDYEALKASSVRQKHGSFCGIASAVAALRTLRPKANALTQDRFFDNLSDDVPSYWGVFFGGLTLQQLATLIEKHDVRVKAVHAEANGYDDFVKRVQDNVRNPSDVMIVNYHRPALQQKGGGHHSPIAAFDPQSQRVLIYDTAGYKYPPTWVPIRDLWEAMKTTDASSNRNRGYLLVSLP